MSYTGGIYDHSTGLYYLNARYYNPEDGRFLTEDTYRGENNQPNTQHLYVYCANNPVNYVDPSGHGPVGIVIGGLIGYGAGKLILPKIANRLHLKGKKKVVYKIRYRCNNSVRRNGRKLFWRSYSIYLC